MIYCAIYFAASTTVGFAGSVQATAVAAFKTATTTAAVTGMK